MLHTMFNSLRVLFLGRNLWVWLTLVGVYPNITPYFPNVTHGTAYSQLLGKFHNEILGNPSNFPVWHSLLSYLAVTNRLPKGYTKIWSSPGKFGPRSLFHMLRLLLVLWTLYISSEGVSIPSSAKLSSR